MKPFLFYPLLFLIIPLINLAQCRPATLAENEAYNRVVSELQKQFTTHTPKGNWKVFDEKHSMGHVEVTSEWGNFIHLCTDRYDLIMENNDAATARSIAIKDTTKPIHSFYVPRDTLYQANPNAIIENAKRMYSVSVEMNLGNYRLQDEENARLVDSWQRISIEGSSMALTVKLKPDLKGAIGREETVVFIGNWNLKPIVNGKDIRFRPIFKKGGKLFENLVITINAPFDLAQEIISNINWQSITKTL